MYQLAIVEKLFSGKLNMALRRFLNDSTIWVYSTDQSQKLLWKSKFVNSLYFVSTNITWLTKWLFWREKRVNTKHHDKHLFIYHCQHRNTSFSKQVITERNPFYLSLKIAENCASWKSHLHCSNIQYFLYNHCHPVNSNIIEPFLDCIHKP